MDNTKILVSVSAGSYRSLVSDEKKIHILQLTLIKANYSIKANDCVWDIRIISRFLSLHEPIQILTYLLHIFIEGFG